MHRKIFPNQILLYGQPSKFKTNKDDQTLHLDLTIDNINNQNIKNTNASHLNPSSINPQLVYTSFHHIAIIDTDQNAWLISQPFQMPVNISKLINMKVNKLTLGLKQMVINTAIGNILVNWGSKKLINIERLRTVQMLTKEVNNYFFQIFEIPEDSHEDSQYYYNYETYNKLYAFGNNQIIGYPSLDQIVIKKKVKGISACKYHCLCWDNQGKLYSWGHSSLALGYGKLPEDQIVETPQEVKLDGKFVITAIALNHYSLALVGQGKFYEWGIKKQVNEVNEESIFHPRPLQFRYFNCKTNFVSVKEKLGNFAALSSNNQLYVWGINAKILLNPLTRLPSAWTGNYLFQPVLHSDLIGHQIVDYGIELTHLCVVIGKKQLMNDNEAEYWKLLKDNTKEQIQDCKVLRKIKQAALNPSSHNKILDFKFTHRKTKTESNIDLDQLRKKYEKNPLIQNHSNNGLKIKKKIIINNIQQPIASSMKNVQNQLIFTNNFHLSQASNTQNNSPKIKIRKSNIQFKTLNSHKIHQRKSQNFEETMHTGFSSPRSILKSKNVELKMMALNKRRSSKQFTEVYKVKVQEMMQKKQKNQVETILQNIRRIEENTLENKLQKKEQQLCLKRVQWKHSLLKRSILAFMVKNFITKLLISPIQFARNTKISNFARSLVAHRVQKNIHKLFQSVKIRYSLQALKHSNLQRFILLQKYVKKYVVRFRGKKKDRSQTLIISSISKHVFKFRIKVGLAFVSQKMQSLSKMIQWHSIYNKTRNKILKQLWNNFILCTFKIKDSIQFYFGNFDPKLNFHQLYAQQMQKNAFLQLNHFIKTSKRHAALKLSQRNGVRLKRKGYIRIMQQTKQKPSMISILPYSMHSLYLKKPRNLQIHLMEGIRSSQLWAASQRQLVDQTINQIVKKFQKQYYLSTKKYELNLAHFIKQKYELFKQKRWIFIIQYNKVIKTHYKERRQKQLRRLLKLIYNESIYEQDCLPQRHIALEEALKHPNAPKPPDPYINFDLERFTSKFLKEYCQNLSLKAKNLNQKMP